MAKIYTGAKHIKITVPTGIDLSSATTLTLLVKRPNGSIAEWTPTVLGSAVDGVLVYYTAAGDLDMAGLYVGMAMVETATATYLGETFSFKIFERFK